MHCRLVCHFLLRVCHLYEKKTRKPTVLVYNIQVAVVVLSKAISLFESASNTSFCVCRTKIARTFCKAPFFFGGFTPTALVSKKAARVHTQVSHFRFLSRNREGEMYQGRKYKKNVLCDRATDTN